MTFLSHANLEADSIRRANVAMSLPKDLFPLAKNMPIPSEWLFGDDINARINNIKAQQKAFKIDKTYFKPERTFDRQAYFPQQNSKNWNRFPKIQGVQRRTYKTDIQESKEPDEKVSIRKHNDCSLIAPH